MDAMDADKEALDELMAFARGGMAREMRKRNGRPLPPEGGVAATEEIPGVETEAAPESDGAGVDPQVLQQILEALRAGK